MAQMTQMTQMTQENFIYWLQGMLEYTNPLELSVLAAQDKLQGIKDHLKLVMNKITPESVQKPSKVGNWINKPSGARGVPYPVPQPVLNPIPLPPTPWLQPVSTYKGLDEAYTTTAEFILHDAVHNPITLGTPIWGNLPANPLSSLDKNWDKGAVC